MPAVRPPAVAGVFYPADPAALRAEVRRLLGAVGQPAAVPAPKALVVPHAGLRYSGPVAATAYACLADLRGRVRTVVLLGPAHHGPGAGLVLSGAAAFASPLGELAVDQAAVARLRALPHARVQDDVHAPEHGLEVQLPFLAETLGDVTIVPLLVGTGAEDTVAAALEALWDGDATLVIVSSDLSHDLAYEAARRRDRETAAAIESLAPETISARAAYGCEAIRGLLRVARARGLVARTLDLRSSADTAGGRQRVVGYGAFAFSTSL
jgi:AmmeMemoRadiSam system protein B